MNLLTVIARKQSDGTVQIFKPSKEAGQPATFWCFFDKFNSNKPDYRNKQIVLNCWTWAIHWDEKTV